MEISASLKNFLEIGFGVIYLIGAVFNFTYTRSHGTEFYTGFADGAWFPPAAWLIRTAVIPNPAVFTAILVSFQVLVGIALLSQGPFVGLALLAGVVFCLYAVFVCNVSGAIANLAMAVLQYYLASLR
jgi:hypothetical protein